MGGEHKCKCSLQFILRFVTHQNICYQVQQVAKWQFHCTTHAHTGKRANKQASHCADDIQRCAHNHSISLALPRLSLSLSLSRHFISKQEFNVFVPKFFIKTSRICQSKHFYSHFSTVAHLFNQLISLFFLLYWPFRLARHSVAHNSKKKDAKFLSLFPPSMCAPTQIDQKVIEIFKAIGFVGSSVKKRNDTKSISKINQYQNRTITARGYN